jgi:hypothetical protein
MSSEVRRVRLESLAIGEQIDASTRTQTIAPDRVLVQTSTKDAYPTTASAYYYCQVCSITGTPTEGGSATVTPLAGRFMYAYNIGTTVPPVGTIRTAHLRDGRYIFQYCC